MTNEQSRAAATVIGLYAARYAELIDHNTEDAKQPLSCPVTYGQRLDSMQDFAVVISCLSGDLAQYADVLRHERSKR